MRGQTNHFILDNTIQRELRKNPTDAERKLWSILRNRQIDGHKFRRQHPFEDYVLDFVCVEARIVVECDGGQHNESLRDKMRDATLNAAGFTVLRFWNNDILSNPEGVRFRIAKACRQSENHPHPCPLLEGEGEEH